MNVSQFTIKKILTMHHNSLSDSHISLKSLRGELGENKDAKDTITNSIFRNVILLFRNTRISLHVNDHGRIICANTFIIISIVRVHYKY